MADSGRSEPFVLNLPQPWWHQGDWGKEATPGGWLRLFGACLSFDGQAAVRLKGPKSVELKPAKQDCWALAVELPKDLPAGDYQLAVHNGRGGGAGWVDAGSVRIAPHAFPWEGKATFDIAKFGAIANDKIDDTYAIQQALDAAGAAGGGTVLVPRGRFQANETLKLPRNVLLKGLGKELSQLYWRDCETPPEALVSRAATPSGSRT